MGKQGIIAAAMAVLLVSLTGAAIRTSVSGSAGEESSSDRLLSVVTTRVRGVTGYETVRTYTGTLVAARASDLSFAHAGEIAAVHRDQGQRVQAGQLLAELDTASLQARRRELLAERAAASALMDELEAGARPEALAAARAEVSNLQAQVELQRLTLQRSEKLLAQRAVSQADVDQARYGLQSLEAAGEKARQQLAELEAGPRVEKKQAQRAVLEQLDAALAVVDAELDNSRIVAPFDGSITARYLDEGAVVAPGQVVLRLVEDTLLEAWFGVPVSHGALFRQGADALVCVGDRTVPAVVTAAVAELDTVTRTQRLVFALSDSSGLYPGQLARLDVRQEVDAPGGFWLPTTALVQGERGLWNCFVVSSERAADAAACREVVQRRDVRVVHTTGARVLVQGMLEEGDQVVSEGTHRVTPGQLVRSVPQS